MPKKIFNINNNLITFTGTKGEEVTGNSEDCKFVGGHFDGTNCLIKAKTHKKTFTNESNILGQGNTIDTQSFNNNIIGNFNTVDNTDSTHTIGKFAHTTRHGEFNHAFTSKKGRAQRSVLMYEGRTTDATETEIFLGGDSNKRFIVDETKECVIVLETYVLARRIDGRSSAAMGKYQHATFRVYAGTLDRIGINNKTNHNDGISGWTNDFVAVNDADLGDYIKATVTGQASCTIDWTVVVMVSELKTDFV